MFHLQRMVLATRAFDDLFLVIHGDCNVCRRMVFQKITPAFRRRFIVESVIASNQKFYKIAQKVGIIAEFFYCVERVGNCTFGKTFCGIK